MSLLHEGHKAFLEQKVYSGQIEELAGAERDEARSRVHGHTWRRRDVELHMPPLHIQAR
jgi:hypothetical protein